MVPQLPGTFGERTPLAIASTLASAGERETVRGLRATIDRAPVGITHFDEAGRLLLANDKFCEMLGYERPELLDRGFMEFTFPEDVPGCMALNRRVAAREIPSFTVEKRLLRRDGGLVWTRVSVSAVHCQSGELAFFVGIAEDISAERAQQAQRRQAEERLHAALDASMTGTFRLEMPEGEVDCDPQLEALFGLEPSGGRRALADFLDHVQPQDRRRLEEILQRSVTRSSPFAEDFRIVRPDGSARWMRAVGNTIPAALGHGKCITGACMDVTRARLIRESLEESEGRMRALLEASPLGICELGPDGDPVFFNARWAQVRGLSPEEASTSTWARGLHPDDRERVLATWNEAMGAGQAWEETCRYVHRDGREAWVSARAAPVLVDGRVAGFVATLDDITLRKAAEAQHERLMRLEHEAREAAERAARHRGEMVATVGHDLRNPLQVVATVAALMERADERPRREQLARTAQRNIAAMSRLLDDLLDLSRIDGGALSVQRQAVDVAGLLAETRELFEASAREGAIALEFHAHPGIGAVTGDPGRLLQVLSNVVGNALKFTPRGGHVAVCAEPLEGAVELSVRDDGPGMDAAQLACLFDRFWKAMPTSRAGAGLGLTIAKGIVEAHGGSIRAESEPGRGTTVRVVIPR